jgi:hypothetical protein
VSGTKQTNIGRAKAKQLGITEEDVVRIINEFREEERSHD